MSLAMPGVGQLWEGRLTCAVWFVLIYLAMLAPSCLLPAPGARLAQVLVWTAIGLASAEHARRCVESRVRPRSGFRLATSVSCGRRGRSAALDIAIDTPWPAAEVWKVVGDLPRFVCADLFHCAVVPVGGPLSPGRELLIEHCAFGWKFCRRGRLLWFRHECGYAFSDLSRRGNTRGFPHVFSFRVVPLPGGSRVTIAIRGQWNAPFIPAAIGMLWLRYVTGEHARLAAVELAAAFHPCGKHPTGLPRTPLTATVNAVRPQTSPL